MTAPPPFTSRHDALAAVAAQRPPAERQAQSLRRFALTSVVLLALAGSAGLAVDTLLQQEWGGFLLSVVLVAASASVLSRRRAAQRRLTAEVAAWLGVEEATRDLPGPPPSALRAPYDARGDLDFPDVAVEALEAERSRTLTFRFMARAVLLGMGAGVGLAGLLGGLLTMEGTRQERADELGLATFGAVVLSACVAAVAALVRQGVAASRTWRRRAVEQARWSGERELTEQRGAPTAADSAVAVAVGAAVPGSILLLVLAAATVRAGALGVVTLLVVVLVLLALVLGPAFRRRRLVAATRGGATSGAVVVGPDGPALLTSADTGLQLAGAAVPAVLAATQGVRPVPYGPKQVDLLHEGGAFTALRVLEERAFDEVLAQAGVRRVG